MLSRREPLLSTGNFLDCSLLDHRHVGKALKELMKNVEPSDDAEVSDNELEDMVCDFLFLSQYTFASQTLSRSL